MSPGIGTFIHYDDILQSSRVYFVTSHSLPVLGARTKVPEHYQSWGQCGGSVSCPSPECFPRPLEGNCSAAQGFCLRCEDVTLQMRANFPKSDEENRVNLLLLLMT